MEDDRGMILWQILYDNLHYSVKERKWFYDLILHNYFKLIDMTTMNISFLMTKILRDLDRKQVNLARMKEILVKNRINGFAINVNIRDTQTFVNLFKSMENVDAKTWEKVYYELKAWKLDEELKNGVRKHQSRYKNKKLARNAKKSMDLTEFKENEITIFNDMTKLSIRNDIDYSNTEEKRDWKEYRHNLKNAFRFFAGYNVSVMRRKELKRFLDICDIKQYWSPHLMTEDLITMDQFIKYLCNEFVNNRARDIKQHIEKQPDLGFY